MTLHFTNVKSTGLLHWFRPANKTFFCFVLSQPPFLPLYGLFDHKNRPLCSHPLVAFLHTRIHPLFWLFDPIHLHQLTWMNFQIKISLFTLKVIPYFRSLFFERKYANGQTGGFPQPPKAPQRPQEAPRKPPGPRGYLIRRPPKAAQRGLFGEFYGTSPRP